MASNSPGITLERYKTAVILKDGSTLHLRPIQGEDEDRMLALFHRFSPRTIYLRFHGYIAEMPRERVKQFCTVDYNDTFALVATLGEGIEEKIIAVGRYYRLPKRDTAEVAFVVEDAYQGKGIGTHLLEQLSSIAVEKGICRFEAEVLAENREMLMMFKNMGFQMDRELEYDVYRVVMDIYLTPTVEEKSSEREKTAAIASLRAFLNPRSIAVIGASRTPGTLGNTLFRNILQGGFKGVLYPVNPSADVVASVKAYPSILDVPGEVDLAIIIVPAKSVHHVVQQCGRKGIWGVVVISSGFGETGAKGMDRQKKLVDTAQDYGMRLVGPNCMGIMNTNPEINMNATFSSVSPPPGNIALCSQSGGFGLAILEYAHLFNIGLSVFISIGNRADVSSNDLLQYFEEDLSTDVILLYLESFGNPRKFARIARRVSATKPIVAVKSGRTAAGSRAAASHTGALATAEVASGALFKQTGIIRVDTLEEFFDIARLLSSQPIPTGKRLAILTNGGGPAIMTADACAARGLELPILSENTLSQLRRFLPRGASLTNPIDMTAGAGAREYRRALKLLAEDEQIENAIVIFIPPIVAQQEAVASAIRKVAPLFRQQSKTLLASFMGSHSTSINPGSTVMKDVPVFTFPEAAAVAISRACEYGEWLKRPKGIVPELEGIYKDRAERIIETALARRKDRPLWLDATSVAQLLDSYGIRIARSKLAKTASGAARSARELGFPVAVKLLSSTIAHKTEVGGVILDLHSQKEVERAFAQIREQVSNASRVNEMQGVIVQEMINEGIEVIIGVTQDPSFGPLMLFGMGGIYTELFEDVAFRIHPLTDIDAQEMVRSVKAYQILGGWRGSPPSDVKAIEELLLRVSAMIEDLPQIAELDLNPVKALEQNQGYVVVDARVMLA